ncbi:MAG: ADP-ribosylglycohydrolase family protein [Planctomycetes bacterium]|nr:ADP-ribosylglycohydrolase family protein [Planctomycetota bacterium]
MELRARYRGCLVGLAVGDALGTTLEFSPPGTFAPIDDMLGGGPFGLAPGEWTDDTSMALCLAQSLVACRGFDARDQMRRYLRWRDEGVPSSTGECFDIGRTVSDALSRFRRTGEPFSGSTAPTSAGNGSLMRLAPVPLAFARDPRLAIERSGESSRTTHGATTAVDACRFFGGLLVGALDGATKDELLAEGNARKSARWRATNLDPAIELVAAGSYRHRRPPEIRGTGYVVESLEAALWAFHHSHDFPSGALLAANLGDDADTTCAIYGQLAGAHYGVEAIPREWAAKVSQRDLIESLADQLLMLAAESGAPD